MRILTIGNSLARNATQHLDELAAADGQSRLVVGRATLGGCSLEKHWNLVEQCDALPEVKPYLLRVTGKEDSPASLREALTDEPWDYVTLQQVSSSSGQPETYRPFFDRLHALGRDLAPQAQIVVHQTWAYRIDGPLLASFGIDQAGMFSRLREAYAAVCEAFGCRHIPCGLAFQKARKVLGFVPDPTFDPGAARPPDLPDQSRSLLVGHHWKTGNTPSGKAELHMDERHGNEKGCYLAHAVWYEMFTGRPIADNPFLPGGVTPEQQALLQAAAHEAVEESGGPLVPR